MTLEELIDSLRQSGVTLRVEGGRLLAKPASALTPAHRGGIALHREALMAQLTPGEAPQEEAVVATIAERAWSDPPNFEEGTVVMRESVILRWPGMPPLAISPEEAETLDRWLADQERTRKRKQEKQEARKRQGKRQGAARLGLGMSSHTEGGL